MVTFVKGDIFRSLAQVKSYPINGRMTDLRF